MKKVFLSYGWCDAAMVSQFASKLEEKGVPVFLDKWDLSTGAMTWSTIDLAMDEAEKLVIFLSRDSLTGKGVREEIDRGLQIAYERHGDVFIIPVTFDAYTDISPLLPVKVRGANMVVCCEQSFDESVQQIVQAIQGVPTTRSPKATPTDFYYRTHTFTDAVVVEVGSGIQSQRGFSVELFWDSPVLFIERGWGTNPPGHANNCVPFGYLEAGPEQHLPKQADVRFCASLHNITIDRHNSFFVGFRDPSGKPPSPPRLAIFRDKYRKDIRNPLVRLV